MESFINTNTPCTNQYHFIVQASQAGQRIDKFLTQVLPAYSRNFFQNLIGQGNIIINKTHQAKSSSILKESDTISITIPIPVATPAFTPLESDLGIEILFTHEHFLVIYKPAGVLVHKTQAPTNEPTVVDWLMSKHNDLASVGDIQRPGIVHRLDKDTSGLMIIARTNYAHMQFSALFKSRKITKTYHALVHGHPAASGSIDLDITRHPTVRKKMTTSIPDDKTFSMTSDIRIRRPTSRAAVTHYKVKEYFEQHALVEVTPITGRTHQIRVHFTAIGHPLVGDYIYGTTSNLIARHALHAHSLSFTFDNHAFSFNKEVPDDFKKLLWLLQNS